MSHIIAALILNCQLFRYQPLKVKLKVGFIIETFEALIVTNNALSNIQKFHYLTASLKGDAKGVINNLQITNENFSVAWKLVTQRYNKQRLISMMHAKNLCCLPAVKK